MFVKFDCGCIGMPVDGGAKARILVACDEDRDAPRDSLSWFERTVDKGAVTPLSDFDEERLHDRIAHRFAKADRYDNLRSALDL